MRAEDRAPGLVATTPSSDDVERRLLWTPHLQRVFLELPAACGDWIDTGIDPALLKRRPIHIRWSRRALTGPLASRPATKDPAELRYDHGWPLRLVQDGGVSLPARRAPFELRWLGPTPRCAESGTLPLATRTVELSIHTTAADSPICRSDARFDEVAIREGGVTAPMSLPA